MADKVAVVTGSNRGIGYAIVKELLLRGVGTVYITARDFNKGNEAVEKLKKEGLNPSFHKLAVTDRDSVKEFADFLKKKHGGLDILINNAGVLTENLLKTTFEDSERVINTNYRSLLIIQEYIFPILKDNARVIHISSDCGHISNLENKYWIERLTKDDLKLEDIEAFVSWFLDSVKEGTLNEKDFEGTQLLAYKISKIAVCALTRVQQKQVGRDISINSLHPGFVQTDMTRGFGMLTLEESGKAPAYLALDIPQSVKGRYFWFDKTEKNWVDHSQQLHPNRPEMKAFLKDIPFYSK